MDRLEAMSLLIDTLDAGSFSAAARLRAVPVATLTRKIGQLEEHLGAALLIRSTRRLALTDAGQRYVAGARHILSQVRDVEREAAGEFVEPTGRLVISAPRMFGRIHVLPIVNDFLRQHGEITVDLQLLDNHVDLAAGAADLAVRIGALPDSGLIASQLGTMRSVVAASPEFLARHPESRHPRDLLDLPAVELDIPLPNVASRLRVSTRLRPDRQVRLLVSGAEAAVEAAEAGIGVVHLLHYQVADALRHGRLRLLLESFEDAPVPVHLVHAPLPQLPLKTRRFLDFSIGRLRAQLSGIAGT